MQCKLVESEGQCTTRSLVACYQKHKRLCHKQVAVYFWKSRTKFCYNIAARYVLLLRVSFDLFVLIFMNPNPNCFVYILVCFCVIVTCT
jgi:hypothetical protein